MTFCLFDMCRQHTVHYMGCYGESYIIPATFLRPAILYPELPGKIKAVNRIGYFSSENQALQASS